MERLRVRRIIPEHSMLCGHTRTHSFEIDQEPYPKITAGRRCHLSRCLTFYAQKSSQGEGNCHPEAPLHGSRVRIFPLAQLQRHRTIMELDERPQYLDGFIIHLLLRSNSAQRYGPQARVHRWSPRNSHVVTSIVSGF
jgi:hypothetical protein